MELQGSIPTCIVRMSIVTEITHSGELTHYRAKNNLLLSNVLQIENNNTWQLQTRTHDMLDLCTIHNLVTNEKHMDECVSR